MDTKGIEFSTIDEYINYFPVEIQKILRELRNVIKTATPEASEK